MARRFPTDMLYAECSQCGQPVFLEPEQTAEIIAWAGLTPRLLDASCMILSEGCPLCTPHEDSYSTQVLRLGSEGGHITARPLR